MARVGVRVGVKVPTLELNGRGVRPGPAMSFRFSFWVSMRMVSTESRKKAWGREKHFWRNISACPHLAQE